MAAPTYTKNKTDGLQGKWRSMNDSQGAKDGTIYSYKDFVEYKDDEQGWVVHHIVGTGLPGSAYDSAPYGSTYLDKATGLKWENHAGTWKMSSTIFLTTADDHTANTPTEARAKWIS